MNNDLPYAPTNDVIFKALFSHHTDPDLLLLKDFLFALTGIYPDTILYENREINTDYPDTKDIRLDIRVLVDGKIYSNIEMQMFRCNDEAARSLAYLCMSITDKIEKGKPYSQMIPVHQIFILDYILFPDIPQGVHTFMMSDTRNHTPLTDKGIITMMEIPKLISQMTDFEHMTHLQAWAYFLKNGNRIDDVITHHLTSNRHFHQAMEVVKMVNNDKKLKDAAFARMRHDMDKAQAQYEGKMEGRAQGIAEGRAEGRREGKNEGFRMASSIMSYLRNHVSTEEIMLKTGASMEEIIAIQNIFNAPVLSVEEKTCDAFGKKEN